MMKTAFGLMVALMLCATPLLAQDISKPNDSLDAWYDALQKPDVTALEALMAPEDFSPFEYEITDFGVKQNRQEFIASMDEWVSAIAGGSIEYKVTDTYEGGYSLLVCYRFENGELLTAENVSVYDTRITRIAQIGKGDTCAGF